MKLAIVGPSQCGKDTVCNWLAEHTNLAYHQSTSEAAAQLVYDTMGLQYTREGRTFPWRTVEQCWESRHEHQTEWARIIWNYNHPNGLRLYRSMIKTADILNGIRRLSELQACEREGLIDLAIWIERPGCSESSLDISEADCQFTIDNGGTLAELYAELEHHAPILTPTHHVTV